MWTTELRIELDEQEREELERLERSLVAPHRAVVRARTVLLLAAGISVSAVAREVGRGRRIVRKWGVRFQKKRLRGLEDLTGRGRQPRFSPRSSGTSGEAGVRVA
jgi:transposase-like protein